MILPKIRQNLLVQELTDEVLIYDQATNKSYCLNETAKTVFNACDGEHSVADVSLPKDMIYFSLDELKRQNLIETDYVSPFDGISRREVIKKVGLASMVALPVITGLLAPQASQAASACVNANGSPAGTTLFGGVSCGNTDSAVCQNVCQQFGGGNCCSGQTQLNGTCPSCTCQCA